MRFILGLTLLFSIPLWAGTTTFTTTIHDIDVGTSPDDLVLILFENGRVARMSSNKMDLAADLLKYKSTGAHLDVEIAEDTELLSLTEAPLPVDEDSSLLPELPEEEKSMAYTPSVLGSMTVAQNMFNDHRVSPKESQCFNRAHIWSYEWRLKHNVYSSKAWIFFTRKFLRLYPSFEWWFHVAPMVHVNTDGGVKERVMEMKYASRPVTFQQWANIFIKGKGPCATVANYSDHADFPYNGYCYFMKSSMYYYQPSDLEFLQKYGNEKNSWVETEVREAYREAFDIL